MAEENKPQEALHRVDLITGTRVISIKCIARQGGAAFWCAMKPFARPSGRVELRERASAREKAIAMKEENAARQVLQLAMLAAINEAKRIWSQSWPIKRGFWMGATIYTHTPAIHKPDLDNYLKFIADAGTGLMWWDDCLLLGYLPGTRKIQAARQGVSVVILPDAAQGRQLLEPSQIPLSIEGREMQGAKI